MPSSRGEGPSDGSAGESAQGAGRFVGDERVAELARQAERAFNENVERLRTQSREAAQAANEQLEHARTYVVERVQERPFTTTLAVLGAGFLIGLLFAGASPVIKKVVMGVIAFSAIAAAVGVAVAAAAFAAYAAMVPALGPAGAALVVAGVAALLVGLAALFIGARGSGGYGAPPAAEASLVDRLVQIARERPVLAAGAALAAGLVALKNPKLAAGLASAFIAGKAADKAADPPRRRW